MATLTLTLDEIVPLLKENLPDPRIRDISAHLNELRAVVEQDFLGKTIHVPVAVRFIQYEMPVLTVRLSIKSKWGGNWLSSLLPLLLPEKEIQSGIQIEGNIISFNLNQLLAARKVPIIITGIDPIDQVYQVNFKLDHHALRTS